VVPRLLCLSFHHKQIATVEYKFSLRHSRIYSTVWCFFTRPNFCHFAKLKLALCTKRKRSYRRLWSKKRSSIGMPSDVIVTIKVKSKQNCVVRHVVRDCSHFCNDLVKAARYWLIRRAILKASKKVGPTWRLTQICKTFARVLDSIPRQFLERVIQGILLLLAQKPAVQIQIQVVLYIYYMLHALPVTSRL